LKFHEIFPDFYRDNETEWYEFIKEILTPEFDIALEEVNALWSLIDIDTIPEEKLPLLAENLGFEFEKIIPASFRKQLANAIYLHKFKGTVYAVEKVLSFIGLSGYLKEWFLTNGNLPPHTFALLIDQPIENIKEIVEFISKYKPLSAHLAFITDGNCRSRLNLDRSCQLSRVLLSSLDGVKKEGIRFCFIERKSSETQTEIKHNRFTLRESFIQVFLIKRNQLDAFKLSRVKGREVPERGITLNLSKCFEERIKTSEERFFSGPGQVFLSMDKLDKKGFHRSKRKIDAFKLDFSKLSRVTPVEVLLPYRLDKINEFFENSYTAEDSYERFIPNLFEYKPTDYVGITRKITRFKKLGRDWSVGIWEGNWTDEYKVFGTDQLKDLISSSSTFSLSTNSMTDYFIPYEGKIRRRWEGKWNGYWTDNSYVESGGLKMLDG